MGVAARVAGIVNAAVNRPAEVLQKTGEKPAVNYAGLMVDICKNGGGLER